MGPQAVVPTPHSSNITNGDIFFFRPSGSMTTVLQDKKQICKLFTTDIYFGTIVQMVCPKENNCNITTINSTISIANASTTTSTQSIIRENKKQHQKQKQNNKLRFATGNLGQDAYFEGCCAAQIVIHVYSGRGMFFSPPNFPMIVVDTFGNSMFLFQVAQFASSGVCS